MSSDIASGVIHRLREVLVELEADKKRLDFLEANKVEWVRIKHGLEAKLFTNLRDAIDHFIDVKETSEEFERRDMRERMNDRG